jgi:chitinase
MKSLFILLLLLSQSLFALDSHLRFSSWSLNKNQQLSDFLTLDFQVLHYDRMALTAEGTLSSFDEYADFQLANADFFENLGLLNQIEEFKQLKPNIKVVLTIGGWAQSQHFSDVFQQAELSENFLNELDHWLKTYHLDGIELDWRYPGVGGSSDTKHRKNDGKNLLNFIKQYRLRFPNKMISITSPNIPMSTHNLDLAELAGFVDFFNLPTDGIHGSWDTQVFHQSPLYRGKETSQHSVESIISGYQSLNVPMNKLVISMSAGVNTWYNTEGLYTPFEIISGKNDRSSFNKTGINSNDIQWDEAAQASYVFNADKNIFYSFESPRSIKQKSYYASLIGLRGLSLSESYYFDDLTLAQEMINASQQPYWFIKADSIWEIVKKGPDLLSLILMMILLMILLMVSAGLLLWRWYYLQQKEYRQLNRFQQLMLQFNQQFSLTTDLLMLQPELINSPIVVNTLPAMQQLCIDNQKIEWLNQAQIPMLKSKVNLTTWLSPFCQKHQLDVSGESKDSGINVDLARIWQASEQLLLILGDPKLAVSADQCSLTFTQLSISQYLQANVQSALRLWQQSGGLMTFESTDLTLSLDLIAQKHELEHQPENKAIDLAQIQPYLEKLSQSKEIEQQIESLMDCLEHMGFSAASAQMDGITQKSFGNTNLPNQWQYEISATQRWQLSLFQEKAINEQQRILLNALSGQFQLLQDLLRQIARSPSFLLDLYDISRDKDKILYIEASKGYSIIHFSGRKKEKIITIRLKQILNHFDANNLVQIHRSYLINPNKITAVNYISSRKAEVILENVSLSASQRYFSNLPKAAMT